MGVPRIAVAPDGAPPWLADAVMAGGGAVVDPPDAEALVWAEVGTPDELAAVLEAGPGIRWVQLPTAGVERFVHLIDDTRSWTCGKGVYAEPVAELALALLLAGFRGLPGYARAISWPGGPGVSPWPGEPGVSPSTSEAARGPGCPRGDGRPLAGARVTVVGGGGITAALLRLLAPFSVDATVVRRRAEPVAGAARVVGGDGLHGALAGADAVVLALALTPGTTGIIGRAELEAMPRSAWLVNVARGRHVVTGDLVDALIRGGIAGAALDVTDPEPLPDGHPLWSLPNCLITPHVAGNTAVALRLLERRVTENVRRFGAGEPLVGAVDPVLGY